jgi:hypothetical protein
MLGTQWGHIENKKIQHKHVTSTYDKLKQLSNYLFYLYITFKVFFLSNFVM